MIHARNKQARWTSPGKSKFKRVVAREKPEPAGYSLVAPGCGREGRRARPASLNLRPPLGARANGTGAFSRTRRQRISEGAPQPPSHGRIALVHIGKSRYDANVMTELMLTAKALADPTRVRIVAALRGRELCVCELCDALAVSQSTLSTHLQVIRDAGLVRTRKRGRWIYYSPAPDREPLVQAIFTCFANHLQADKSLRRDAKKVRQRLAERDGGECCRGFGSTNHSPRKKRR